MAVDLSVLKTELRTDPKTLGYATHITSGNRRALVAVINRKLGTISVDPEFVTNGQLQSKVVGSEYVALSDAAQRAWGAIIGIDEIPIKDAGIRAQILAIWTAGTTTRANMATLQSRNGSRGEELFGEDTLVTFRQCGDALNL